MSRRISFLKQLFSSDPSEKNYWILKDRERVKTVALYSNFGSYYNNPFTLEDRMAQTSLTDHIPDVEMVEQCEPATAMSKHTVSTPPILITPTRNTTKP